MPLSFLSPSRTVLMISDEALFIYTVASRGAKLIEAVPWSAEDFTDSVATIISKDCGGKPVLILNDMVEQHYRKEKVPKVSIMDRGNVVKRKLKVAFPSYPVRAALPLKEKLPKEKGTLGGNIYIFSAVPASEAFTKTMAAAAQSLAPIAGFCLLPIEASDMIKKLSEKLKGKGEKKAQWTVFMGQHKSGSLRQIVTKNGELALTRMTPISDHDEDPLVWAQDVHQEFNATMSYLSRFGFDSSDGLNVILLSDSSTGDMVHELIETPCDFYALTSDDAARKLGVRQGVQETLHHADALHCAWIGRKSRFILPMKAKQIDSVSQPRQVAALLSVLLILGGAFLAYQIVDYMQGISEVNADIENSRQRKSHLDLLYQKEVKRKEDLGYDIKLIQSSLAVFDSFEEKQIDVLPLFYRVGMALGRDMKVDRVDLKRGKKSITQRVIDANGASPLFVADMQMTFPSTTDAEKGNEEVKQFRQRLQRLLPDHVVTVTKLLEDYEYSEEIVVETGNKARSTASQDYVAEISVEGPAK